ncbi:uncharacterized protein LDX57_011104 [Aspergillus melleus]|uniref:uncharacterized protein n=1 Tax=Aspergillus melleus TaxID=138277 RepID=UPI001E8EAB9D|nr:uncharacterized protein LDX57_011104 [Aspergillus melleus]KAH8433470.1 hypothetical protein LDX57_011104 [Aspergillus melleus]
MSREQIIPSKEPRTDALAFVTSNGRHTLKVDKFLEASRPGGGNPQNSYVTHYPTPSGDVKYAPAFKGITGHVIETGQSFTIRDDYDFANPSSKGKGYHVNAQLGKVTKAFTGQNTEMDYYHRIHMTGERVYFDGVQEAASWYTQGYSR